MNLLIDQDDQQNPQPIEEPQETPEVSPQIYSEPASTLPPDTPEDYYRIDREYTKKRNVVGPVVIIMFLVLVIAAAAYFSFFYKSSEFPGYTPMSEKKTVVDSTATVIPSVAAPADEKPATSPPPAVDNTEAKVTQPKTTTIPENARPASSEGGPISRAAQMVSEIVDAAPEAVKVGTVVVDDNSFSAELSGSSRSVIETFYASMKSKFGGDLSFSPVGGGAGGARALYTGNFHSGADEGIPAPSGVDAAAAEKIIRQAISEKGLKVVELSRSKPRTAVDVKKTPFFIKVSGSSQAFNSFCSVIEQSSTPFAFSKIIALFTSRQQATYVLRLELLQRS
jgi:hypothetical protein